MNHLLDLRETLYKGTMQFTLQLFIHMHFMWCAISTYSHCLVSRLALLYFAISFIQAKALITSCKLIKMSVILTK